MYPRELLKSLPLRQLQGHELAARPITARRFDALTQAKFEALVTAHGKAS